MKEREREYGWCAANLDLPGLRSLYLSVRASVFSWLLNRSGVLTVFSLVFGYFGFSCNKQSSICCLHIVTEFFLLLAMAVAKSLKCYRVFLPLI